MILFFRLTAIAAYLIGHSVVASIAVNQTIVRFEPGGVARQDVEVFNHGQEPVFLQVEAFEIVAPGDSDQKRVKVENPKTSGLLITPKRTAISAGGRQLLRFVNLKSNKTLAQDKIYRVTVTPISDPRDNKQASLKVVIAYEILVIIRPKDPQANLVSKRDGDWLEFRNTGNSNVLLRRGKQCEKIGGKENCLELPGKRLYAGNSWRVKAPFSSPVIYEYAIGPDNFEKSFQ